jgi:PKD domain
MRAHKTVMAGAGAVAVSVILTVACLHGPPQAFPAPLYVLHASPRASFVWFPQTPRVGEQVLLVSTSTEQTSPITRWAWDLSDNPSFGAFVAGGPVIHTSFATPAPHVVRLRVTDKEGASDTAAESIHMSSPPPGVLSPFPIVRIVGRYVRGGVKLKLLQVKAPRQATIRVTCETRACPRALRRRVSSAEGNGSRWVRFREFARIFTAGAKLEIKVSRGSDIGAYTRFTVRRRRIPLRFDSCLDPAGIKPIACPTG